MGRKKKEEPVAEGEMMVPQVTEPVSDPDQEPREAEQTEPVPKEDWQIKENRRRIVELLKKTGRDRIDVLIEEMDDDGFFTAPASGGHHSNQPGGLAAHTLNVVFNAEKIGVALLGGAGYNEIQNSVIIAAILHDLGKVGDYGKKFYVENMVQDGRPTKADPVQKYKQSEKKPWKRNPDLTNIPHGIRSAIIANRWFELTEEEEYAICFHDAMYEPFNRTVIPGHETPLLLIIHWADMWASHVQEGVSEDDE